MKSDSLKKNFIYQMIYQGIMLILPLILSPIVTRRLGETSLGIYTYVTSIAYYFIILADLGIQKHAQRIIANSKNDEDKLRRIFWSLFVLHIIISFISMTLYTIFVLCFVDENETIYWLQLIYLASALFDITWLFYGLENFKTVVIKNFIVKMSCFALIILFVKNSNDLMIYTLIEVAALLFGNLLLLPSAIRLIKPIKFSKKDLLVHIKPMFYLSIVVIAVALYTVFDKTLLGIMTNKENVAFYEYSNKIINIPKAFTSVIGSIIFPRACYLETIGDHKGQTKYAKLSYVLVSMIACPAIFGLISVGPLFAVEYYGESFKVCGNIIIAMSPLILTIGLGDIIRSIYLIPKQKDIQFIIIQVVNAMINIVLSIILIPHFGIYGAVLGTIAAEVSCLILVICVCRKDIQFWDLIKPVLIFSSISIVMSLTIYIINGYMIDSLLKLLIDIIVGIFIYAILSVICFVLFYREYLLLVINKFKNIRVR